MASILVLSSKPDYEAALSPKGHKIFSFTDEGPAVDCAQSQKLDCVLIDADLPGGLEVFKRLSQTNSELRLITVMGIPSLPSLREAISLGAQEILFAPLDADELENKVTKVAKATKRNLKEALAL